MIVSGRGMEMINILVADGLAWLLQFVDGGVLAGMERQDGDDHHGKKSGRRVKYK